MSEFAENARRLAAEYAARGEPCGWSEEIYAGADGDPARVYWADLEPGPHLVAWLARHPAAAGACAVTVGCGLGDDAEALAAAGYAVTAFDISPTAIAMCRERWSDSPVDYRVADLFDHPPAWRGAFAVVYECNTIQTLAGDLRTQARDTIAGLAAPEGHVLVSCRSREQGEQPDAFPLPLDRHEIDGFVRAGLAERGFDAYDDTQDPPVPHFFAVYQRPASR